MCRTCPSRAPTRHISIFAFGSEGLDVCHTCEMKIVEFVRELRRTNSEALKCQRLGHLFVHPENHAIRLDACWRCDTPRPVEAIKWTTKNRSPR